MAVRTDVWVYLIFVIVSGESRGRGRLAALLQSLLSFISVLSRLSAAPFSLSLSLMNFCHVFHLSVKQTHSTITTITITHRHHQPFIPCTPTHAHHPLCLSQCFCHYCCCRLQASPPLGFGNNISFKFASSRPHVFPKLHTYAHYTHLASLRLTSMTEQTKGNPLSHRCV